MHLKRILRRMGMSLATLSQRSGVSRPTLYRLDRQGAGAVSEETFRRVQKILGRDADLLALPAGVCKYLDRLAEECRELQIRWPFSPAEVSFPIQEIFVMPLLREVREGGVERHARFPIGFFLDPPERSQGLQWAGMQRLEDLVHQSSCLLVTGEPGAGKTALLKFLAHSYATGENLVPNRRSLPRIPLLVDLRTLSQTAAWTGTSEPSPREIRSALVDHVMDALGQREITARDEGRALPRLRQPYLLLFDGLEEAPPAQAPHLLDAIGLFPGLSEEDRVIVTSRSPVVVRDTSPYGVLASRLEPLGKPEKVRLATALGGRLLNGDPVRLGELIHRVVQDPVVSVLARNPLLLTFSALVYASRGALPPRVADIVRAIVDCCLSTWERRGPDSDLGARKTASWIGPREVRCVLEDLALDLRKESRSAFPRARWSSMATAAFRSFGVDERNAEFVADEVLRFLLRESGLLAEASGRALTYLHSTIGDHFAAESLRRRENLALFLRGRWYEARWQGVVGFAIDAMDARPAERCLREVLDDPDPLGAWLGRGLLTALRFLARDPRVYDQSLIRDLFARVRMMLQDPPPEFPSRLQKVLSTMWPVRLSEEVCGVLLDISLSEDAPEPSWRCCMRALEEIAGFDRDPLLEWLGAAPRRSASVQRRARGLYRCPEVLRDDDLRREVKDFMVRSCDPALARAGARIVDFHAVQQEEHDRFGVLGGPGTDARVAAAAESIGPLLDPGEPEPVRREVIEALLHAPFSAGLEEMVEKVRIHDASEDLRARADSLLMDIHGAWDWPSRVSDRTEVGPIPEGHPLWARHTALELARGRRPWDAELAQRVVDALRTQWTERDPSVRSHDWDYPLWDLLEARTIREPQRTFHLTLREILQPFAPSIQAAFIFGSQARGAMAPESDIDLFVIGDIGLSQLAEPIRAAEERLNRVVNPVVRTGPEVRRLYEQGSAWLDDVLRREKHFILGSGDELGEVVGAQVDPEAQSGPEGDR